MVRIFELAAFGSFGTATLIANAAPASIPGWLFQFGALGLCAFMIAQNFRQQSATSKTLDRKDGEIAAMMEQLKILEKQRSVDAQELANAMKRLAEALEDRPCLHGDQRVPH